ncbi:unknown [Fusobacterium sp. CAG:439]|nr:unknown [Fusobacterium sp. CAG:439]
MHTGDFSFKHKEAFEKFQTHYDSVLNNVQILQIPHHGSEKNSSNEDFKIFPNLKNKYVTMQENPNGKQEPKLSPEYINDKTIYLATENERIKKYLNLNILIWLKKS